MDTVTTAPDTSPRDRLETLWIAVAPVLWRLTLAVFLAFVGMWVFGVLAHGVADGATKAVDSSVIKYFRYHQAPLLHALMRDVTIVAGPNIQTILALVGVVGFIIARRFWPDGLALLIAGLGGAGLTIGLKFLFHRQRPTELFTQRLGYSFPSGHSFFAVVLYGFAAYEIARLTPSRYRRWIWLGAVGLMALVGFSRVYLQEHYPSDVAAGWAIGIAWLRGSLALPSAFHRKVDGMPITTAERRRIFDTGLATLQRNAQYLPNLRGVAERLRGDKDIGPIRRMWLGILTRLMVAPSHAESARAHQLVPPMLAVDLSLHPLTKSAGASTPMEGWDRPDDVDAVVNNIHEALDDVLLRDSPETKGSHAPPVSAGA